METLFENVFPLLILLLVVGWWILRGVFNVVRRSVTGMDEEVEVGRLAADTPKPSPSPSQRSTPSAAAEPSVSLGLDTTPDITSPGPTDSPGERAHISDLPSIDDLARENRRARDQMRDNMPSVPGLSSDDTMRESAPTEIVYPDGSAEMLAQAWDRIYSDKERPLGI